MEEKKYPGISEDKGSGMIAAEPAVAYTSGKEYNSLSNAYTNEDACDVDDIPLGMFGFYTDDPEVFEQRVAEMEADIDEVEAGIEDPEKWIRIDDFWTAMRKEHPWL